MSKAYGGVQAVRDVSFAVRAGEILGLGGLVGAGRSETVEAVFGLRPRSGGTVDLAGKPLRPDRPQAAIRAGMGFVADGTLANAEYRVDAKGHVGRLVSELSNGS